MKKLALWISILIIAAVLFTFCTGAEAVVIQGESSPGNYINVKVDSSGNLSSTAGPTTGALTNRSGTMTAGGTAQTLAPANSARKYIFIENVSTENMYINFTTAAVQGQPSILLPPNSSFVMENEFVSTELISIISTTTGSAYTAKEF